ncbi:MAG TPA: F0F1 ATP synthase subunit B [Dongiaceae bacterium]|nr:F0F1 ATP synthase subunit B [Dongiaceae bacterium]
MNFFQAFAEATAPQTKGDIFTALGIDWRLLILQIVAFLILVWLLGKFVYPYLMKSVDQRKADIETAAKAAKQAQENAAETQEETAKLLAEARQEASDIITTAKLEATEMVSTSEKKAKDVAEKIVADAHSQLEKDVAAAKRDLHNETLDLVALATAKVVGETLDKKVDKTLISDAVKETK